jgi:ketosteroid isomerase-like protein
MIRYSTLTLVAAWAVCLLHPQLSSQVPPQPSSVELPADLASVLVDYENAWLSHDSKKLAALFADDGFVLSNGHPPVSGRSAIERFYADAGGPLSLRAFAFAKQGIVGYIIGGYSRKKGDPDSGKFTLTLRKSGGARWLIVSDMDNSNKAP